MLAGWAVAAAGDTGRAVYRAHCYFCHGYAGDARTVAAGVLSPPPADFTRAEPGVLTRERMIAAVGAGRPGTAMRPYGSLLAPSEIAAVVDYVRSEFLGRGPGPERYHSPENGWSAAPGGAAADYATGRRSLDEDVRSLSPELRAARERYLRACVSCHVPEAGGAPRWTRQAVSYPPGNYPEHDASGPSGPLDDFVRHHEPHALGSREPMPARGERLFQDHCAHCHAADGSGRNWIGTFLDPSPRDLATPGLLAAYSDDRLLEVVRRGIPGTSMSAWGAVLEPAELDALVAYMRAVFQTPAAR